MTTFITRANRMRPEPPPRLRRDEDNLIELDPETLTRSQRRKLAALLKKHKKGSQHG